MSLRIFPAFEQVPALHKLDRGGYEYRAEDWDGALNPATEETCSSGNAGDRKRKSDILTEGLALRERLDARQDQPPRQRARQQDFCQNCGLLDCSVEHCCACGRSGCHIRSPDCPFHLHGSREQHADAAYGDTVAHFAETQIQWDGQDMLVDGRRFRRGAAPGTGNNCLIWTLTAVCGVSTHRVSAVRAHLQKEFRMGPEKVTARNYLTAEFHWEAILRQLGKDPAGYKLVVISDHRGHGSSYGGGTTMLAIENIGNSHFQPLLPVLAREAD